MIAELLDTYLSAVHAAGLVGSPARPGPDEKAVRRRLRDAGYEAGDDLVDFLTWTGDWYAGGPCDWFWEMSPPLDLGEAIGHGDQTRSLARQVLSPHVADLDAPPERLDQLVYRAYPGPDHWFPLLMVDGHAEFVAIDCSRDSPTSGAVFYLHPSAENFAMFSSLAEAIETAIYCVHAGLWTVEGNGYTIACDRPSAPDPADLTNPPWA